MLTYITQTPIDEELTEVNLLFSMKALPDEKATESISELNDQITNQQFTQDVPIWENKIYRDRPTRHQGRRPGGAVPPLVPAVLLRPRVNSTRPLANSARSIVTVGSVLTGDEVGHLDEMPTRLRSALPSPGSAHSDGHRSRESSMGLGCGHAVPPFDPDDGDMVGWGGEVSGIVALADHVAHPPGVVDVVSGNNAVGFPQNGVEYRGTARRSRISPLARVWRNTFAMRPTLYEYAGGYDAFLALATAHHSRCLADPELNHPFSHPDQHPEHVERLATYWAEVMGGPALFSETCGDHSSVLQLHAGNGDMSDLGRRFVECFVAAADDAALPEDREFRAALRAYMEWAVDEVLEYGPPGTSVRAGLAMPHWTWEGRLVAT